MASKSPEITYKVILLGNSGVGKTNLLLRYADNTFDESSKHTLGVELERVELEINKTVVRVDLWDTAGQERFKSLNKVYFRGAHGVIIVYDITNSDSFTQVGEWYRTATSNGCDANKCLFLLVGNKVDLAHSRAVATTDGVGIATQYQMEFFETSAKDETNVERAFNEMIHKIHEENGKINAKDPRESKVQLKDGRPVEVDNEENNLAKKKSGCAC